MIYEFIREWTLAHDKMDIMAKCQAAGCPVSAVFTIEEAVRHPHLHARNYFVDVEHPALGTLQCLGAPFRLPASPGGPKRGAPLLGQHNDAVWGGLLGKSAAELDRLRAQRVI